MNVGCIIDKFDFPM